MIASLDICSCSCHSRIGQGEVRAVHMFPCCIQCPGCKRNIVHGRVQAHQEQCSAFISYMALGRAQVPDVPRQDQT